MLAGRPWGRMEWLRGISMRRHGGAAAAGHFHATPWQRRRVHSYAAFLISSKGQPRRAESSPFGAARALLHAKRISPSWVLPIGGGSLLRPSVWVSELMLSFSQVQGGAVRSHATDMSSSILLIHF